MIETATEVVIEVRDTVLFNEIYQGQPTSVRVILPPGKYPARFEELPATDNRPASWVTIEKDGETFGLDQWTVAQYLQKDQAGNYHTKVGHFV